MFAIKVDKRSLERAIRKSPEVIRKNMDAAVRGGGYYLFKLVKAEAATDPIPVDEPPISAATRKREYWPQQFVRIVRYHSNPDHPKGPRMYIGVLVEGRNYGGIIKTQMTTKKMAQRAWYQSKGYQFNVTPRAQKYLAWSMQSKRGQSKWNIPPGRLKRVGLRKKDVAGIWSIIPKRGVHRVKAKPYVARVWRREHVFVREMIVSNFAKKMRGERF